MIPYKQILRELKLDLHGSTKTLFPFINRTLNRYGLKAVVYSVGDNWIQFHVKEEANASSKRRPGDEVHDLPVR